MNDENCIFCKIIKGDILSFKVFEDDFSFAFLDIAPFVKGHTIVIPKKHYINLLDFPESEMKNLFSAIKHVAMKLKQSLNADGINLMQNNFKAAGQIVNHLHFHLMPRWEHDKAFPIRVKKLELSKEELSEILNKINKP